MKSIFLAAPLSGYSSNELKEERAKMLSIVQLLEESIPGADVFYAGKPAVINQQFDSPLKAAEVDFGTIDECDVFILVYQKEVVTSALVEIGYALAKKKQIRIFTPTVDTLPFLLRELPLLHTFVKISIYRDDLLTHIEKSIQDDNSYFTS